MQDEPIHCPNCGSQQLTANKKGLSITKAALGGFLLGPVGLAAGAIGKDKIRITCLKCGRIWEPGDLMRPVEQPPEYSCYLSRAEQDNLLMKFIFFGGLILAIALYFFLS